MKHCIAIFGPSCSGKTTVAKALGERIGLAVRNCGELVRQRAAATGVTPDALTDNEHRKIDAATRNIAKEDDGGIIIEGSFLDHVLAGLDDVWFVKLEASDEERERRHDGRGSGGLLSDRDAADERTRERLYQDDVRDRAMCVVDTTGRSVSDVVDELTRQWRDK